jgi:hypothetical protein
MIADAPQAHRPSLNGARAPQYVHSPISWRQYFSSAPTSSSSTPGVSNPSGWLWVASSLTNSANVAYSLRNRSNSAFTFAESSALWMTFPLVLKR